MKKTEFTAKERLDRLINKARAHLYKPIQIAEVLYRHRVHRDVEIDRLDTYRRDSTRWRNEVCERLIGKTPSLNSRYEDQLFDPAVLPLSAMGDLAKINKAKAVVETYIYTKLRNRFGTLGQVRELLRTAQAAGFQLKDFLSFFDDPHLRRSVDKAYEIIVYSLFDSITRFLGATVTLRVDTSKTQVLKDFEQFVKLVLGVDPEHPEICQPARLYRVGTANAADAGIDMWANFGPAVQIKHITVSEQQVSDIVAGVMADRVIIVCRKAEAKIIEAVLQQVGLKGRIQGFITEKDLVEWYNLCMGTRYANTLGKTLLVELNKQFEAEFPLTRVTVFDAFFAERKYSEKMLTGDWSCTE